MKVVKASPSFKWYCIKFFIAYVLTTYVFMFCIIHKEQNVHPHLFALFTSSMTLMVLYTLFHLPKNPHVITHYVYNIILAHVMYYGVLVVGTQIISSIDAFSPFNVYEIKHMILYNIGLVCTYIFFYIKVEYFVDYKEFT